MRTPHVLGFCSICGLTIICGTCGNNQCNGGRGLAGTCADCDSAYALLQFADAVTYAEVRATRSDIRDWQARQLKSIRAASGADNRVWLVEQVNEVASRAFVDLQELERALKASDT